MTDYPVLSPRTKTSQRSPVSLGGLYIKVDIIPDDVNFDLPGLVEFSASDLKNGLPRTAMILKQNQVPGMLLIGDKGETKKSLSWRDNDDACEIVWNEENVSRHNNKTGPVYGAPLKVIERDTRYGPYGQEGGTGGYDETVTDQANEQNDDNERDDRLEMSGDEDEVMDDQEDIGHIDNEENDDEESSNGEEENDHGKPANEDDEQTGDEIILYAWKTSTTPGWFSIVKSTNNTVRWNSKSKPTKKINSTELHFSNNPQIYAYRWQRGWALRFVRCGVKKHNADHGTTKAKKYGEYVEDVEFKIPYPSSSSERDPFRHVPFDPERVPAYLKKWNDNEAKHNAKFGHEVFTILKNKVEWIWINEKFQTDLTTVPTAKLLEFKRNQ